MPDVNIREEIKSCPDSQPCHCNGWPYLDKDHDHILIGNSQIVGNKLRKILSNGPKYRQPKP